MKKKLHEFSPNLYRGPRIASVDELAFLQEQGFTHIVNLQTNFLKPNFYYGKESEIEKKYGIKIHNFPLHWYFAPSQVELDNIYECLKENNSEKIFIHCKYGVDRTGMVVAYWKVREHLAPLEDAIKEMLSFGFHARWFFWWIPRLEKYLSKFITKVTESDSESPEDKITSSTQV